MLTRIYIHNFRAFVNFEYRMGRQHLIVGPNGSGKSSFVDAFQFVRRLILVGDRPEDSVLEQRTRWLSLSPQVFEIEAEIAESTYVYRAQIESRGSPEKALITREVLQMNGEKLFELDGGTLFLYGAEGSVTVHFSYDGQRSGFTIAAPTNPKFEPFRAWLADVLVFRINPFSITGFAQGEDLWPMPDMSNFAAWYRHLTQDDPLANLKFFGSLREVLPDFGHLKLEVLSNTSRTLEAWFRTEGTKDVRFRFAELSEGQRCLVCLYAILHFSIEKGRSVIIDEPDNFIALRELQPWLVAVDDALAAGGQVLLISHHPEIINQWLPDFGVQFYRDGGVAPIRVKRFEPAVNAVMAPAELIARGWEHD